MFLLKLRIYSWHVLGYLRRKDKIISQNLYFEIKSLNQLFDYPALSRIYTFRFPALYALPSINQLITCSVTAALSLRLIARFGDLMLVVEGLLEDLRRPFLLSMLSVGLLRCSLCSPELSSLENVDS